MSLSHTIACQHVIYLSILLLLLSCSSLATSSAQVSTAVDVNNAYGSGTINNGKNVNAPTGYCRYAGKLHHHNRTCLFSKNKSFELFPFLSSYSFFFIVYCLLVATYISNTKINTIQKEWYTYVVYITIIIVLNLHTPAYDWLKHYTCTTGEVYKIGQVHSVQAAYKCSQCQGGRMSFWCNSSQFFYCCGTGCTLPKSMSGRSWRRQLCQY